MWNGAGGPHLYRKYLIDMTKLVDYVEKKYGKVSVIGRQIAYNADDKTWSAYPDYYINNPGMYRKDLWGEIGMTPDTWDDIRGRRRQAEENGPSGWPVILPRQRSQPAMARPVVELWRQRPGRERQARHARQQGGGRGGQIGRRAL
jgi:hypothetical protein